MIQPCRLTIPITIQTDSQSAKALAEGSGYTGGLRHVAVQYHFVRDLYEVGLVEFEWIRSEDQLADPLTKNTNPTIVHEVGSSSTSYDMMNRYHSSASVDIPTSTVGGVPAKETTFTKEKNPSLL